MKVFQDQRGVSLIEFTFTALIFLIFFIAVIEFARVMFVWNTVNEANRQSARLASICEMSELQVSKIKNKVKYLITAAGDGAIDAKNWLAVEYLPLGCSEATCEVVKSTISEIQVSPFIPIYGVSINLPPISYSLIREQLSNQVSEGDVNPICE